MSSKKLSPTEILHRRKIRLQVKTDALTDILEENFVYLQNNAVSLVSESAVDILISKMPPFVQGLLGRKRENTPYKMEKNSGLINVGSLALGALDIIPLFLRGKKGFIANLIINRIKKLLK